MVPDPGKQLYRQHSTSFESPSLLALRFQLVDSNIFTFQNPSTADFCVLKYTRQVELNRVHYLRGHRRNVSDSKARSGRSSLRSSVYYYSTSFDQVKIWLSQR